VPPHLRQRMASKTSSPSWSSGSQEYPSRETVEADALRVVVIIPASGSGVVEGGAFHNICTMYAIHKHKLL
jgi:hypothetical protein